ncbi:MAG: leucine--tRNA ligase, partial [Clostridia bacterium]|nr:leucine--tRNA ligase [Clostridia bacterium]
YMVLSPEHPFVEKHMDLFENASEVKAYRESAARKSDFERTELVKEKTGAPLKGVMAINPVNNKEIPVWISDYVLMTYGTGAIMAVPAHDERDWDFAKKFNLPIIKVVDCDVDVNEQAFTDVQTGVMVNSDELNGLSCKEAISKMVEKLEKEGKGHSKVNYKLRDWVFSRQRYWGEPIPLIWCDKCGWVPVDEKELPLRLPNVDKYELTDDGESPIAKMTDWVNTTCPKCGASAKRETDTMPQWAGSSWYFLRYIDPKNTEALASGEELQYWLPVDWYNGGMEHTTLHLLYSRFWHKFLYDIGVVPTKEPYAKRTSHGMILGENNEKMSKSRGNVINPDDIVNEFGADTFRTYEMFIGAFDQATPWSMNGVKGCYKFMERVWAMQNMLTDEKSSPEMEKLMHKTIKKVTGDIEKMKFNTAIAALMTYVNEVYKVGKVSREDFGKFLILLNPTAPHITEEMWVICGFDGVLSDHSWPSYDEEKTIDNEVEIVVQLNGRVKMKMVVSAELEKDALSEAVLENDDVKALIDGKSVVKVIAVKGKLVNIVVK